MNPSGPIPDPAATLLILWEEPARGDVEATLMVARMTKARVEGRLQRASAHDIDDIRLPSPDGRPVLAIPSRVMKFVAEPRSPLSGDSAFEMRRIDQRVRFAGSDSMLTISHAYRPGTVILDGHDHLSQRTSLMFDAPTAREIAYEIIRQSQESELHPER